MSRNDSWLSSGNGGSISAVTTPEEELEEGELADDEAERAKRVWRKKKVKQ